MFGNSKIMQTSRTFLLNRVRRHQNTNGKIARLTDLYQVRNRYYHTALGRWLSRDPLENAEMMQGPNLYGYVLNGPINNVDPQGKFVVVVAIVIVGAFVVYGLYEFGKYALETQKSGDKATDNFQKCDADSRTQAAKALTSPPQTSLTGPVTIPDAEAVAPLLDPAKDTVLEATKRSTETDDKSSQNK